MSQLPPPLPTQDKPPVTLPWILWIVSSTLLPASPFLFDNKGIDGAAGPPLILLALVCQLTCSIWLARLIAQRRNLGVGGVIAFVLVLMAGSVAIGMASFFGACVTIGPALNFH